MSVLSSARSLSVFRPNFRSATWRGALIGVICAVVCWGLNGTPLFRGLENWACDSCFALRGRRASTANVIIVALDEPSLQEIDKPLMFLSPELAIIVAYLHEQGAAAIGVDFLLPRGDKTMEDLQPNRRGDMQVMGQSVGQAGNVVLPEWLQGSEQALLPPYEWYDRSLPSAQPWADLGFVDQTVDPDSCLRRQELRRWTEEGVQACFALSMLVKATGLSQEWLSAPKLTLDGTPISLDAEGSLPINYVGPAGSIRTVSFRDVLAAANEHQKAGAPSASHAPRLDCKNAVVLIGTTVTSLKDVFFTPYTSPSLLQWMWFDASRPTERQMSGVEVHANVLATLMDQAFITTPWFLATPLLLVLVGGVMGALLARCSLEVGALLTLFHHLAWRSVAVTAFCLGNWRAEMVSMLVLGVLLYGTVFALRWRWIRRMMGMVKSEAVARALEAGGAKLDLRGRQCEITVLFCDIRNFTLFSERHSPHEVVRLLNAFFTAAVPAIEAEGGTVNQYIGDAMMVIFGAPQPQPDHALRAVRAAIEVVRRVHGLQDRWKELGAEEFRIGIGIHTGLAVVGTVGSPRRLDYTAIGDTVNTAARIESANKQFQSEVLISHVTFSALDDVQRQQLSVNREPMPLSVKGKQEALLVHAVAPSLDMAAADGFDR
jgi:adenylate cyclase